MSLRAHFSRIWPQSLLWRSFLLIALLILLSMLAWFSLFRAYELEPRARQTAQLFASVVNLTRGALINAAPERRRELLLELSEREGIRIYPADPDERLVGPAGHALLERVAQLLRDTLGNNTRVALQRNGESAIFISFALDEGGPPDYWVALPSSRIERVIGRRWLGWSAAALLLSLIGAWLIVARLNRPLRALSDSARQIGRGEQPAPLAISGPTEIRQVALAFNQMNADLARVDNDRRLILAGISHDLRTPLTRLRMTIELLPATDEQSRQGMIADIEDMDQSIGQFLDFAREQDEEAAQWHAPAQWLHEFVQPYRRRGVPLQLEVAELPSQPIRVQGLRRALANLIDNALKYAGSDDLLIRSYGADSAWLNASAGATPATAQPCSNPQSQGLASAVGHYWVIEVQDRGPGIASSDIERLKRPFTRLDQARSNVTGAGLGLAIVERIMQSQGGQLQLLPRPGNGLCARLLLPLHSASAA